MNPNRNLFDEILLGIVWLGVIGAVLTFDPVLIVMVGLFSPALINFFTEY
jgi:hypothetical protein